jgi:hypothetical protein
LALAREDEGNPIGVGDGIVMRGSDDATADGAFDKGTLVGSARRAEEEVADGEANDDRAEDDGGKADQEGAECHREGGTRDAVGDVHRFFGFGGGQGCGRDITRSR